MRSTGARRVSRVERTSATAYERLGGESGITGVVDQLYRRVEADEVLAPYFHDTHMPAQRRRLVEMIGEALGGPSAPWLKDLRGAHEGRGITHRHYSRMAAHLMAILEEGGAAPDEVDTVASWLATGRAEVVEDDAF